jgi:hypothetical protein
VEDGEEDEEEEEELLEEEEADDEEGAEEEEEAEGEELKAVPMRACAGFGDGKSERRGGRWRRGR